MIADIISYRDAALAAGALLLGLVIVLAGRLDLGGTKRDPASAGSPRTGKAGLGVAIAVLTVVAVGLLAYGLMG